MEFLTGKDREGGTGWSVRDRGLAEALTEHESSFCSGCNQKAAYAWDEDSSGHWEAHPVYCEACAAVERAQKEDKNPEPGTLWRVALSDSYERPTGV